MNKTFPFIIMMALSLSGCGSGNEPVAALGSSVDVPSLSMPLASTVAYTFVTPFSTTAVPPSDGILFTYPAGAAVVIVAPGAGLIAKIDTTLNASLYAITIYHNAHYSTRLSQITSPPIVRVGDYVSTGSTLGSMNPSTNIMLNVTFNGSAVCPLSLLSADARGQLLARYASNPCLQ